MAPAVEREPLVPATAEDIEQAPAIRSEAHGAVVALAAAAGLLHAVAMVNHFREWWAYGGFFLVVMSGQPAVGRLALPSSGRAANARVRRDRLPGDHRRVVLTRTVGLPIGPEAGRPEHVGGMDLMASLDQLVIAALVTTVVAPTSGIGRRLRWITGRQSVRLVSMCCSASVFAILPGGHH